MSRPLRIQYPNAWYHVMNRARRGQGLYPAKEDIGTFLDLLKETATMFNLKVSAYCLMPTHIITCWSRPRMQTWQGACGI